MTTTEAPGDDLVGPLVAELHVALVAAKLNQRKAEMTILRLAEANRELHERIKNLSKEKNS